MHIQMMSPIAIAMQTELCSGFHPTLLRKIKEIPRPEQSLERRISEIAAHLNVQIDGVFNPEGVDKVLEMLLPRLQNARENPNGVIILN